MQVIFLSRVYSFCYCMCLFICTIISPPLETLIYKYFKEVSVEHSCWMGLYLLPNMWPNWVGFSFLNFSLSWRIPLFNHDCHSSIWREHLRNHFLKYLCNSYFTVSTELSALFYFPSFTEIWRILLTGPAFFV